MKVAITSTGNDKNSVMDIRFGRAAYFMVFDEEAGSWEAGENKQNFEAVQGAGIQAAQNVAKLGAEAVITGNVGPKAFKVLAANKIRIYSAQQMSVEDAYKAFLEGKLPEMEEANVEGHWV